MPDYQNYYSNVKRFGKYALAEIEMQSLYFGGVDVTLPVGLILFAT